MLIFNTTFHVDDNVKEAFIDFMKLIYIPQSTNSGFLHEARFAKIRPQHEQNGSSYALQFKVKNSETLNYWLSEGGLLLQQQMTAKFGNRASGFITILEEIDL